MPKKKSKLKEADKIRPHVYEDSISLNGVATPFCKHCRKLYSDSIHITNEGMIDEEEHEEECEKLAS